MFQLQDHPFRMTSEVSGPTKGVVLAVVPGLRSYERGGQYRLDVAERRPSSEASEASAALITITFNLLLVALHIHISLMQFK